MPIFVNGTESPFVPNQTLVDVVDRLHLSVSQVAAIELDGSVVHPDEFGRRSVPDNATIEVVQFVGGG